MQRVLDILLPTLALAVLSPVMVAAAVAIRLCSPGPIFYKALRVGKDGRLFTMYKFRTMHAHDTAYSSRITALNDPRVFPLGALLRRTKVDELPQFFNILKGDMAIVGPRPEDPEIVSRYYRPEHYETLARRPGLSSPGTLFYYTQAEHLLEAASSEEYYARHILPAKLALDKVYVRQASLVYDLWIMVRTVWVILALAVGKRVRSDVPESAITQA
jgi:lipopolysaccharide/colanic/teichoic acid biosynthesis glycosyltransferase